MRSALSRPVVMCALLLGAHLLSVTQSVMASGATPVAATDPFRTIVYLGAHPLYGGTNLFLRGDGTGVCQVVTFDETQRRHVEARHAVTLDEARIAELNALLEAQDFIGTELPRTSAEPESLRLEIGVTLASGRSRVVSKWSTQVHGGFDAVLAWLRELCVEASAGKPVAEGLPHDRNWRPEGFPAPTSK
ncbi:MAG: hypothetical protein K2Y51_13140 [Gammaproteobacteria bacterium]|nr:hypothetical protein [Gammaproteobacteria bacterium]